MTVRYCGWSRHHLKDLVLSTWFPAGALSKIDTLGSRGFLESRICYKNLLIKLKHIWKCNGIV